MKTIFKTIIRSFIILGVAVVLSLGALMATGTRSASAQNQDARAGHSHVRGNSINLAGVGEVAFHFVQVGVVTAIGAGIVAFTKRNKRVTRASTAHGQIPAEVTHG